MEVWLRRLAEAWALLDARSPGREFRRLVMRIAHSDDMAMGDIARD